jgi:hypothetical protein
LGGRRCYRDALTWLWRRHRDARRDILRNDGGAGRRRQRLRLHGPRRRHALARQRTIGRRQHAALRQFRHFLFVVGLLLVAAGNVAGRARRGIGKDIADLRARGRRKRDRCGGKQGRKTGQGNGSKHLAALKGESGSRHSNRLFAARRATG